jgi:hypothetical protein
MKMKMRKKKERRLSIQRTVTKKRKITEGRIKERNP